MCQYYELIVTLKTVLNDDFYIFARYELFEGVYA